MWVCRKIFSGDMGQWTHIYQCIPLNIANGHLAIGNKNRLKITPLLDPFSSVWTCWCAVLDFPWGDMNQECLLSLAREPTTDQSNQSTILTLAREPTIYQRNQSTVINLANQ